MINELRKELIRIRCVSVWVCACVCVHTHTSVHTHLCCGQGCQCWNLHSRWQSAPREDCSSPSHHRNTITMATKVRMNESWEREYEKKKETVLCYFKLSIIFRSKRLCYQNATLNAKQIINRWLYTCTHSEHTHELSHTCTYWIHNHTPESFHGLDYFSFGFVTLTAWRVGARIIIFC